MSYTVANHQRVMKTDSLMVNPKVHLYILSMVVTLKQIIGARFKHFSLKVKNHNVVTDNYNTSSSVL